MLTLGGFIQEVGFEFMVLLVIMEERQLLMLMSKSKFILVILFLSACQENESNRQTNVAHPMVRHY
jgi:hypothetical protein